MRVTHFPMDGYAEAPHETTGYAVDGSWTMDEAVMERQLPSTAGIHVRKTARWTVYSSASGPLL